jgi:hypothetical protein
MFAFSTEVKMLLVFFFFFFLRHNISFMTSYTMTSFVVNLQLLFALLDTYIKMGLSTLLLRQKTTLIPLFPLESILYTKQICTFENFLFFFFFFFFCFTWNTWNSYRTGKFADFITKTKSLRVLGKEKDIPLLFVLHEQTQYFCTSVRQLFCN